ncbi:hypothetical protein KIL84_022891, partial [Mauremys mutica]
VARAQEKPVYFLGEGGARREEKRTDSREQSHTVSFLGDFRRKKHQESSTVHLQFSTILANRDFKKEVTSRIGKVFTAFAELNNAWKLKLVPK